MIRAALLATLLPSLGAQDSDRLFDVREAGGRIAVSANRAAVPCDVALVALGSAVGWNVRFSGAALRERLADELIDLSIEGRAPRIVANLIASAGGADVTFVDRDGDRDEMVVVEVPDASLAPGRERLRRWALEWYRACLDERPRATGDADDAMLRVRMHMADVLRRLDRPHDAALVLEELYAIAPGSDYVPQALLRMAECWFELGPETWIDAERRARDLTRLHPGRPEAAAGTVLLARILLAQGRAEECAAMLERSFLRLADQPEIVDVYLLLGTARFRLADPAGVTKALATLAGGHDVARLGPEQQLDRAFLSGYAHLESGRPRTAVRELEQWFAAAREDDPRRGEAFVLLGRAYHGIGRFLQARAAALAARRCRDSLDRRHAALAAELYATTALALGDEDRAIAELESEARRDPDGDVDLTLMVAGLFLERGRHARCIDLLARLGDRDDEHGDRARMMRIEAWFAQAQDASALEEFVAGAIDIAGRLVDPSRQRRAAELVGRAHELLGDYARAADAYRGVLR